LETGPESTVKPVVPGKHTVPAKRTLPSKTTTVPASSPNNNNRFSIENRLAKSSKLTQECIHHLAPLINSVESIEPIYLIHIDLAELNNSFVTAINNVFETVRDRKKKFEEKMKKDLQLRMVDIYKDNNWDLYKCVICTEEYVENKKTLPCGHDLCHKCNDKLVSVMYNVAVVKCPICREVSPVNPDLSDDFAALKRNGGGVYDYEAEGIVRENIPRFVAGNVITPSTEAPEFLLVPTTSPLDGRSTYDDDDDDEDEDEDDEDVYLKTTTTTTTTFFEDEEGLVTGVSGQELDRETDPNDEEGVCTGFEIAEKGWIRIINSPQV